MFNNPIKIKGVSKYSFYIEEGKIKVYSNLKNKFIKGATGLRQYKLWMDSGRRACFAENTLMFLALNPEFDAETFVKGRIRKILAFDDSGKPRSLKGRRDIRCFRSAADVLESAIVMCQIARGDIGIALKIIEENKSDIKILLKKHCKADRREQETAFEIGAERFIEKIKNFNRKNAYPIRYELYRCCREVAENLHKERMLKKWIL